MNAIRREHRGAARDARLTVLLGSSTGNLTITADDLTGWPTGSVGPFFAVLDKGESTEEKVLCLSRSGNVITVYSSGFNGRAQDNTTIAQHSVNATLQHCITAQETDEANAHIMADSDVHGVDGVLAGVDDVAAEAVARIAGLATKPTVFTGTGTPTADRSGDEWMDGNYSPPRKRYWNGTSWAFSGGGPASVSGVTGSPATGSYSAGGITYDTWDFTGSGSVTVDVAGLADILIIGGGGGGGTNYGGGGGGGGFQELLNCWLPVGATTVTVGPGGIVGTPNTRGASGGPSSFGSYTACGGGGGGTNQIVGGDGGGCGGGGGNSSSLPFDSPGGAGYLGQGYPGGTGWNSTANFGAGGGGGAGGAGGNGSALAGGVAGIGRASSLLTGSPVTYCAGGAGSLNNGGSPAAGGANTGNGGGGGGTSSVGGSGRVVLRVARP